MTTHSINVNSAAFRLEHRPQQLRCECGAVAVRREYDTKANVSRNVCAECKKGK